MDRARIHEGQGRHCSRGLRDRHGAAGRRGACLPEEDAKDAPARNRDRLAASKGGKMT